jgi:putative SOS response-associated peptidase YedK
MCGRTAQTTGAVLAASTSLSANISYPSRGRVVDNIGPRVSRRDDSSNSGGGTASHSSTTKSNQHNHHEQQTDGSETLADGTYPWRDNFNMSPGHDAVVFTLDKNGQLQMDRKVWGLVAKGGTSKSPLPEGPSKHFANLMFNARSDTLFSKPTFAKLLNERKACLCAIDGFYEWKADPMAGKGKKQPYFVFRKEDNHGNQQPSGPTRPYLLMAGLWTSVPTGYSSPKPLMLDSFTLLTTEVCDPLKWLHSRMPVCLWDEDLAWKWLNKPSSTVLREMDDGARKTTEHLLQWHAVSTQMSSATYRRPDAIKPVKHLVSVKAFFAPAESKMKNDKIVTSTTEAKQASAQKEGATSIASSKNKRSAPTSSPYKNQTGSNNGKKAKTATSGAVKNTESITSFFAPTQPQRAKDAHPK